MDFYRRVGALALGSRLRRLTEQFSQSAGHIYSSYGVDVEPRCFPVLYSLWERGPMSVTELARHIGQSHASVSKLAKLLKKRGYCESRKKKSDKRVQLIELTAGGRSLFPQLLAQCRDVRCAANELIDHECIDVLAAIELLESRLEAMSLHDRVEGVRRKTMTLKESVRIVDFAETFADDFRRLNQRWIEKYFALEAADTKVLDAPVDEIINHGGYIFIALIEKEGETIAVGTVAMIKLSDDCYEMAKMAVSEDFQGLGIGKRLGERVIEKANELGLRRVYLESNSQLIPALSLYRKLGFTELQQDEHCSPYARCDIKMELWLET